MRSVILVGIALACTTGSSSCGDAGALPPPAEVRVVRSLEEVPPGPRARGVPGDFLLRNQKLSAIVAGAHPRAGFSDKRGTLVDAAPRGLEDSLYELAPALAIGGGDPEPAPVERVSVIDELGPAAERRKAVEVRGTLSRGGTRLDVRTVYRLDDAASFVRIETTVTNRGAAAEELRLGDRVYFGNAPPWAPGQGRVTTDVTRPVRWFGFEVGARGGPPVTGSTLYSYLWAPEATAPIATHFNYETIYESFYQGDVVPGLPPQRVAAGASLAFARRFHVERGDLAQLASHAGWRGTPLGRIGGTILAAAGAGAHSGPLKVLVENRAAEPIIEAAVVDNRWSLELPVGRYQLRVVASGVKGGAVAVDVQPRRAGETVRNLVAPGLGTLSINVVDGVSREPLFARVILSGVPPTATPWLGPEDETAGGADSVYTRARPSSVSLPAGRYRLLATRGPEYTLDEREIEVPAGGMARVELAVRRVVDTRGWVAADLHLHAAGSPDSFARFEDRVISLVAEGIELCAATDHNRVSDYAPAIRAVGAQDLLVSLVGEEITTRGKKYGHFNIFPMLQKLDDPDLGALPYADVPPKALFRLVRALPTRPLLQVNHPRMPPDIGYYDMVGFDPRTDRATDPRYHGDYDAIEVFNGTDLSILSKVEINLREWFHLLNHGHRYTATGNSDSHRVRYESAGYPRNLVRIGPPSGDATSARSDRPGQVDARAAVDAIRRGRVVVTNGPFVEIESLGKGPGETVKPAAGGRLPVRIRVQAPDWQEVTELELWSNGAVVDRVNLPPTQSGAVRYDAIRNLTLRTDGWIVAVVRGRRIYPKRLLPFSNVTALAFTNPIWIDANGDGRITPPGPRAIPAAEERR